MERAGNSNNLESVGPECEQSQHHKNQRMGTKSWLLPPTDLKNHLTKGTSWKMWRTETYQPICLSLWYTPGSGTASHRSINKQLLPLCHHIMPEDPELCHWRFWAHRNWRQWWSRYYQSYAQSDWLKKVYTWSQQRQRAGQWLSRQNTYFANTRTWVCSLVPCCFLKKWCM